MEPRPETQRFKTIQQKFELPMVFFTLSLLAVIFLREIVHVEGVFLQILYVVDFLIWLAFVVELTVLTYLSRNRVRYLLTHWYNILIILIPVLRVFRLVQLIFILDVERLGVWLASVLRFALGADVASLRVVALFTKSLQLLKSFWREYRFNYVVAIAVLITLFFGTLVSLIERTQPESTIKTTFDGIWWSIVSITTVGYGDVYPVTTLGRIIAIVLMLIGITAFSLLTANIASFLVDHRAEDDTEDIQERLQRLEEKVDRLLAEK